jgi:hypothetical protein
MNGFIRPRTALAGAVAVAVLAVCAPAAGATLGLGRLAHRLVHAPLLHGLSVSLGCANPANRTSLHRLLAAAEVPAARGVRCFSRAVAARGDRGPAVMRGPVGLGPAQIQSAYGLAGLNAAGRTVAIVDAYDDPHAASDLAHYRSTFGLPACGSGCFTKVNQNGAASPLPRGDYGWAEEISLDLDAVSAACPSCHILLVEANSAGPFDIDKAEDAAAAAAGVVAISNSFGGSEDPAILAFDAHFNHPGKAITASSGDSGYGVNWPASSPYVTAVGGTTLSQASNARGWSETAWSGAGSGCSVYEPQPSWQTALGLPGCSKRIVADVSADADPSSGLGIYDTYNGCGSSSLCDLLIGLGIFRGLDGWAQAGGTSLSSPLVASVYALAGNTPTITYGSYPYGHRASLNDVTSGSNGSCFPSPDYLCQAGPGYDGPTGLGTPRGTGAF